MLFLVRIVQSHKLKTLKMSPQIEKIPHSLTHLGEGPHWDHPSQTIYFVDIYGHKLLRYSAKTHQVNEISTSPQEPSFIIPIEGKNYEFVISLDNQIVHISWPLNGSYSVIKKLAAPEELPFRFNDAKCDFSGRLWAGIHRIPDDGDFSKTEPVGSLHMLDRNKKLKKQLSGIKIANGMAFDNERKKFYYNDTAIGTIDQFDYDPVEGSISNREVLFTPAANQIPGFADGMTIDSDGNLWVALFNGQRILHIDTKRKETLLSTIVMPVDQITSLAFGGQNLDELYATTGALNIPNDSNNGGLYRITKLGAKGLPANNFKLTE